MTAVNPYLERLRLSRATHFSQKTYSWLLVFCIRDTFRKLRTITEKRELTRELQ